MGTTSKDYLNNGTNCQIDWCLKYIGDVSLGESEFKIKMPLDISNVGGVYQILAPEKSEHYVGQSDNLNRRFYRDYQSSGYHPTKPKRTNRMVVDWVYSGLQRSSYEVYVCTSAKILINNATELDLNFNENRYHRLLVESAIISCRTDLKLINKI